MYAEDGEYKSKGAYDELFGCSMLKMHRDTDRMDEDKSPDEIPPDWVTANGKL